MHRSQEPFEALDSRLEACRACIDRMRGSLLELSLSTRGAGPDDVFPAQLTEEVNRAHLQLLLVERRVLGRSEEALRDVLPGRGYL